MTLDYMPISTKTGIHGIYGIDSFDGKPGDDTTFIFAEYVVGGTNTVGIYQTENSGATWTKTLELSDVSHFHSVRFDPFNPNHVYATTGDASVDGGFKTRWYKSVDSGKTWNLVAGGSLGEGINLGQTPMIDGVYDYDKYMRTTCTVMGVDTGVKGRNSIFYYHDNSPTSFVRFDKTTGKFQKISGDLPGVAYGAIKTKDGILTVVENTKNRYDVLHYVKFPLKDDDIDKPEKYEIYSAKIPRNGIFIRQNWTRQQDISGGMVFASHAPLGKGDIGLNLLSANRGIATKINLSWLSNQLDVATLTIKEPATENGYVTIVYNGVNKQVNVLSGDTVGEVASKIRATTIVDCVLAGTDNVITFKSVSGVKVSLEYTGWSTGANGEVVDAENKLIVGFEPIMAAPQ